MKPLQSIRIPAELDEQLKAGAALVISISGGKDSEAMYYALLEVAPTRRWTGAIHLVHADLGDMELAETPAYVEWLAERFLTPLHIVRHHRLTGLLEAFEERFQKRPEVVPFSDSANRFCTSDFKRGPISKWIRNFFPKNQNVVCAIGLRADESKARAKKPLYEIRRTASAPTKKRLVWDWYPIIDWNTEEVWHRIHLNDSKGHPVYEDGAGNERVSCAMCILACKKDLRRGAYNKPHVFHRLCNLEIRSGKSYQPHLWLATVAPELLSPEQLAWYQSKGII